MSYKKKANRNIEIARIRELRIKLDKDRSAELKSVMTKYDTTTYLPALRTLRMECGAIGHHPTEHRVTKNNGWTFRNCKLCGGLMEKIAPIIEPTKTAEDTDD